MRRFVAALRGGSTVAETAFLLLAVLLPCAVVVRARRFAARRAGGIVVQQSWGPGVAFGMVTAAVAPWAPLPVIRPESRSPRVHAVAPVLLAGIGLVLFVEAAAFGMPVIRMLATAVLVTVASLLVPVAPLAAPTSTGPGSWPAPGHSTLPCRSAWRSCEAGPGGA